MPFPAEADVWAFNNKIPVSGSEFFGHKIDIDGGFMVIGTPSGIHQGEERGTIWVAEQQPDNTWHLVDICWSNDGQSMDRFGGSVAISGDIILAGAPFADVDHTDQGAVYVFQRDPVTGWWNEIDKLVASDGASGDLFGWRVAMDEDRAVIGALAENNQNGVDAGAIYVFRRQAGIWTQET
jgi:hypothetical protein